jgi:YafQ family addiction module toxin component
MRWEQLVGRVGVVERDLVKSGPFKSDLKTYNLNKDGSAINALVDVLRCLGNKQELPAMYDDHPLTGKVKGLDIAGNIRDCHPQVDRVLIYEIVDNAVLLYRFGKHSNVLESLYHRKFISRFLSCECS